MRTRPVSWIAVPVALLHLFSCTAWVIREGPPASTLAATGDGVRVTTTDGRRFELARARVEGDSLVGERRARSGPGAVTDPRVALALDEVASVETREDSGRRTALLVGGILGGAILLFLVIDHAISDSIDEALSDEFGCIGFACGA